MTENRPLRITFVYEYGQDGEDWMLTSLIRSLQVRLPDLQVHRVHGVFRKYYPGGLHPTRIVNLVWVYVQVAWQLFFSRSDAVFVRSTPPCVQLWTVWLAQLRAVPVFCWLMDYHPEMEARQLEKKGHAKSAGFLRRMDAALMPRFSSVVTLDKAMEDFARIRTAGGEVLRHPTWGKNQFGNADAISYLPGNSTNALRLAYSGNLGAAHDLAVLGDLIAGLARRRSVQLYVVGASEAGQERFRAIGKKLGVAVETHSRVAFGELRGLYEQWRIDAGIVLLAADSAGLVSPSKFSGYINFGLPIIYVGPPDTNTAEICEKFGGGWWVPAGAGKEVVNRTADSILNPAVMTDRAKAAKAAARHFSGFNSETLADLLAPRFRRVVSASSGRGRLAQPKSSPRPVDLH